MSNFSAQGYQIIRELGRNAAGGRVVYLCQIVAEPSRQVVIKQFQFAKGSGWAQFKEIEREMQVLKDLKHPGIPHYIGSIETDDGYSIVQEYKDAQALSMPRSFDSDQIKQIAVATLEILIYLQDRMPVVIHRDIKPENVLVDEDLNVYLIDFGFARIGGGDVAMSSVAAGTFGFMAPEQMYNKGLTTAADLYGLGATLIALLTQTKSNRMDALIDEDGKITFQHLTSKLSSGFMDWLETMVAPRASDRYLDAEAALIALKPIYVTRSPSVEFSPPRLQFHATQLGERITKTLTIINNTPDTMLEGTWSIEQHPHDPPNSNRIHKWISLSDREVNGNRVECEITVDTSKLTAQSVGTRSIILTSNAVPETHSLSIEVITAPLPIQAKQFPYQAMVVFLMFAFGCGLSLKSGGAWSSSGSGIAAGFLTGGFLTIVSTHSVVHPDGVKFRAGIAAICGGFFGLWVGGAGGGITGATFGALAGTIAGGINMAGGLNGVIIGTQAIAGSLAGSLVGLVLSGFASSNGVPAGAVLGAQAGLIGYFFDAEYARLPESRRYQRGFIFLVFEIIAIFGFNLGVMLDRPNGFLLLIALVLAVAIAYLLLYVPSLYLKKVAAYRNKEKYLIKL
ncbi:serine/threonine-protein kinase [Chamaesiphon sp. GL140_3_metabinner_50]|uniref:serine/threonine protein kinase n=1 Tax=Chamaesiphon sp. GL140_3_metabinner_50 TaxID=2970812 RepID=UPI0025DA9D69|nr:serine/threonine-protein kinase [Chamaesiphon sp. GL140_3_metabinner_50]